MLIHVCFGTNDLARSAAFFDAIAAELGIGRVNETERSVFWANPGLGVGFAVTKPYNGEPATFGNGTMATIAAPDRATVERVHAAALASGGTCEGPPGERASGFYAAYFRDPEGNKLNVIAMG